MIERTEDYRRVKRVTLDNPMSEGVEWHLVISSSFVYLMEVQDGEDAGVWCFEPSDEHGYLMHTAMGPGCRGKAAVESGLKAIQWLYDNTDADNITAPVPVELKHAQRIPRAAGLEFMGEVEGSKLYFTNREKFSNLIRESA